MKDSPETFGVPLRNSHAVCVVGGSELDSIRLSKGQGFPQFAAHYRVREATSVNRLAELPVEPVAQLRDLAEIILRGSVLIQGVVRQLSSVGGITLRGARCLQVAVFIVRHAGLAQSGAQAGDPARIVHERRLKLIHRGDGLLKPSFAIVRKQSVSALLIPIVSDSNPPA